MTETNPVYVNTLLVNNNLLGIAAVGTFGGNGTRIILGTGTTTNAPYAIGANTNALWYGVPSGASHIFYGGIAGTQEMLRISPSGILTFPNESSEPIKSNKIQFFSRDDATYPIYGLGVNVTGGIGQLDYNCPELARHNFYVGNISRLQVNPNFVSTPYGGLRVPGNIVQVRFAANNTETVISTSLPTYTATQVTVSITPLFVNSIIYIQANLQIHQGTGTLGANFQIRNNTLPDDLVSPQAVDNYDATGFIFSGSTSIDYHNKITLSRQWIVTDLTARNFTVYAGKYQPVNPTIIVNDGWGRSEIIAFEVVPYI